MAVILLQDMEESNLQRGHTSPEPVFEVWHLRLVEDKVDRYNSHKPAS